MPLPGITDQAIQALLDYNRILIEGAQRTLDERQQAGRVRAVIALRAGLDPADIANHLNITTATLNEWAAQVAASPEETKQVQDLIDDAALPEPEPN